MAIDAFNELFNIVYTAKKLYDMGKYHLVEKYFSDALDYDVYFEDMYYLMENIFEHHHCGFSESRMIELHVLSDPVITDFYALAGEYGKRCGVSAALNPYFKAAQEQARRQLNFSYCLDWILAGHTDERSHRSRLGLLISQEDYVDLGLLAYGLVELYDWFSNRCVELKNILYGNAEDNLRVPREEEMAA